MKILINSINPRIKKMLSGFIASGKVHLNSQYDTWLLQVSKRSDSQLVKHTRLKEG